MYNLAPVVFKRSVNALVNKEQTVKVSDTCLPAGNRSYIVAMQFVSKQ